MWREKRREREINRISEEPGKLDLRGARKAGPPRRGNSVYVRGRGRGRVRVRLRLRLEVVG